MSKKVTTATKTTVAGGSAGVLTTWLAIEAQRKYGLPAEVASVIVGGIFAAVARWAGKLFP